jgi:integrase
VISVRQEFDGIPQRNPAGKFDRRHTPNIRSWWSASVLSSRPSSGTSSWAMSLQEVQRLLRHKTLRITLETYVHWWPKRERRRGLVGTLLRAAASRAAQG